MIILMKDKNGTETALNMAKTGWTTRLVDGDDSSINIDIDGGSSFTIKLEEYDRIKDSLRDTGSFIDLTYSPESHEEVPR